jgi:hypothetical protein
MLLSKTRNNLGIPKATKITTINLLKGKLCGKCIAHATCGHQAYGTCNEWKDYYGVQPDKPWPRPSGIEPVFSLEYKRRIK